jgi:hypothetical protein
MQIGRIVKILPIFLFGLNRLIKKPKKRYIINREKKEVFVLDISEQILQSMDIIAKSVVDGLEYNKTITCTIIDDSNREEGAYQVSDGSTEFTAYSDTHTYRNDTVVYVTIPNGDFTK